MAQARPSFSVTTLPYRSARLLAGTMRGSVLLAMGFVMTLVMTVVMTLALGLGLSLGSGLALAPATAQAQNGTIPRLEGPSWIRVLPLEGVARIDPNAPAQTIVFRVGGVSGSTGCNGYGGKAHLSNGVFKLGPLRMSRRACHGPVMNSEHDFMARVGMAAQWWLRGDDLYLADSQGTPLLRFMRE